MAGPAFGRSGLLAMLLGVGCFGSSALAQDAGAFSAGKNITMIMQKIVDSIFAISPKVVAKAKALNSGSDAR